MKTTRIFFVPAVLYAVVMTFAFTTAPQVHAANTMVTGWETGYSYHQGLANGDGALLEAGKYPVSSQTEPSSAVSQSNSQSMDANGTTLSTEPQSPELAQNTPTYEAPATEQAASPGFLASLTPIGWVALGLLALLIGISFVFAAFSASRTNPRARMRVEHRYS